VFRRPVHIVFMLCAILLAAMVMSVSSAAALSPWWHLTSTPYPAYLDPGKAVDEVQQVTVQSGKGSFTLSVTGDGIGPRGEDEDASASFEVGASLAKVREGLEGMYGAGTVEVTGTPGTVYDIKFVGALEYRPIPLMKMSGPVTLKELMAGRSDGVIVATATNLGDAAANPAIQPIVVSDELPAGVEAVGIEGTVAETSLSRFGYNSKPIDCSIVSISCTFTGLDNEGEVLLPPYEQITIKLAVRLDGAQSGELNRVSAIGGGAPAATATAPLIVNSSPVPFGIGSYEVRSEEEGGGFDTQAGSHPFQATTTFAANGLIGYDPINGVFEPTPAGPMKDLHFKLPPGLIGNPTPFARCTLADFLNKTDGGSALCSRQTVIGMARVTVGLPYAGSYTALTLLQPVFNLEPAVGEPARFGFVVNREVPVLLTTGVRTGTDYGVTVNVLNISHEIEFLGSEVTFWGIPGDPRHNNQRGETCINVAERVGEGGPDEGYDGEKCNPFEELSPPPLLVLPTSCNGPMQTVMEADSWLEPHNLVSLPATEQLPAMDGCNRLPFEPSIRVTPDDTEGSKPTGLNVDVHVAQSSILNPNGLAGSDVRGITVALPEGVAINPSGGGGLEACSEGLVGFGGFNEFSTEPGVSVPMFTPSLPEPFEPGVNFCANASKIGTVTIHTPLLPTPIEGFVYLAAQESNPFGSLLAMYIVARDPVSGTVVKLPGVVHLTESGQIVSTFENNPQLPFEDAELHFFGGERAPLASPSRCGTYTTEASFTPWSGGSPIRSKSSFEITSGPNHSKCVYASEALPFSPTLTGGALSVNAGWFSPFDATFSRLSGEQNMQSIEVHLPPGLSGILTGVELCPEPQANLGECGSNSLIGETTVGVGVGGEPYTVSGGKFYLTGPYNGRGACTVGEAGCAPFGITFVVPAKAGPFDLADTRNNHPACDCVLVRGKIEINPINAAITITSNPPGSPDAIPTILEGIPLEIQHVNAITTRNDFQFNPTNCNKMQVTGTIHSSEGAVDTISVPFQVTNCAVLAFKPSFGVSTSGKTSRANGASLDVKLTYPKAPFGTQANIKSVKVDLPKQLPSRLTTLQKACTAKQFEANPSGCPAASIVGHAKAITPLIPVPLTGPAYFVSYGGAKFPELVIVLQGYGVTLDVHGETFISKAGITSSTFHTIPDAPVGSFELNLPQGPNSALAANGNLCKSKLAMPTAFTAQNGMEIHESTKIAVTGCAKAKKAKAKKSSKHRKGKPRGKKR
jgi:hypothetical protein